MPSYAPSTIPLREFTKRDCFACKCWAKTNDCGDQSTRCAVTTPLTNAQYEHTGEHEMYMNIKMNMMMIMKEII